MSKNQVLDDPSKYGIGGDYDDEDDELDRGDDFVGTADDDEAEVSEDAEVEVEADPAEQVADEQAADDQSKEDKVEEVADEATPTEDPKPQEPKKDNRMVPRDRLNQEIAKRKALEAQLQQALAQPNKAPDQPMTVQTLDKAKLKAALEQTLDGKTDDAVEVLAEVMLALQPQGAPKQEFTTDELTTAVDRALEAKSLANRAAELVTENAFLDESNEAEFDADAAEEVLVLRDLYVRRGMGQVDALNKAVSKVAEDYGYAEAAPAADPAPKQMKPKPADITKKAELAKKTPGRIPKSAEPQGKQRVTVEELSDDEFDKLSAADIARARGDIL